MTKEKYILMFKNDEVLSFLVIFDEDNDVAVLEKLEHFDEAPEELRGDLSVKELSHNLFRFFNSRSIASTRRDYDDILKATKCRDSFKLSFKGHGLSLSNHYWFKKEDENLKYEDINFFTNKWDDSFARAVLSEDYKALENVDLNVPDIVTPGWGVKGWLCEENGPVLCKFGIDKTCPEEVLGEVLASKLARRLIGEEGALEHELRIINGHYASCSKCMIGINEELIPLDSVLPRELAVDNPLTGNERDIIDDYFNKLIEYGYKDIYLLYVKIMCLKSLAFVKDFHFGNLSMIKNLDTDEIFIAPLYDLGGAYGGSRTAHNLLAKPSTGLLFIVYFAYGGLQPNWDYSWYNPDNLIGFEEEMKEILSKSDFYNEEMINNIIDVYHHQKSTLDEFAKK